VRIALPVLDDMADDMYQSEHRRMNRTVEIDTGGARVGRLKAASRVKLGTSLDALRLLSSNRPKLPAHLANQLVRFLCPPISREVQPTCFSLIGQP
jgi:hypothetical protein